MPFLVRHAEADNNLLIYVLHVSIGHPRFPVGPNEKNQIIRDIRVNKSGETVCDNHACVHFRIKKRLGTGSYSNQLNANTSA